MKTRLIVIGFGFMGRTHAGSLLKMPDAELTGILDPVDPKELLATITGNDATKRVTPEVLGASGIFKSE